MEQRQRIASSKELNKYQIVFAAVLVGSYPWAIPVLGGVLIVVAALLSYAGYLLYKELRAVKEITTYINQTLTQGFTLPQVIAALRLNNWSDAHISKSLQNVALGYIEVAAKRGKPAQVIKGELLARAWPQEIVDRAMSGRV